MSVKSKTQLDTDIDTSLASGTNITAAEHRALEHDIVDSYEDFVGSYTTAQIAALVGMTLRQRVFNTTDNDYEWYDGTRWVKEAHPKYKVYKALMNQTGTDAPVPTILDNNVGTIVWTYDDVGSYIGTLSGAFTTNKTWISINPTNVNGDTEFYFCTQQSANSILLETKNSTFGYTNGLLNNASIKIEVYY